MNQKVLRLCQKPLDLILPVYLRIPGRVHQSFPSDREELETGGREDAECGENHSQRLSPIYTTKTMQGCAVLDLLNTLNEMFDTLVKTASVYEDGSYAENAGGGKTRLIPYRSRIEELKKYIVRHINEKLKLDDFGRVSFT